MSETFRKNQNNSDQAVAGEALAANRLVKRNSDNKLVYADAGDRPIGYTLKAWSADEVATYYRCVGMGLLQASGAFTAGDLVKAANDGKVVVETSATTPTVYTVGYGRETATDLALVEVEFV